GVNAEGNTISDNDTDGVHADIGDLGGNALGLTVTDNTIDDNGGNGVALVTDTTLTAADPNYGATVASNEIARNTLHGILVDGGGHQFAGNTVAQNWGHGVLLDGSSFNALGAGNWVNLNGGAGLAVVGGSGNTSRQTEYAGNGGLGIDLGDDGVSAGGAPVLT